MSPTGRWIGVSLAVATTAGLAFAGCPAAPRPEDPYVAEVTRAAREERANRYAEASSAYESAAALTSDEMVARSALYRAAQAADRAEDTERALLLYGDLAERWPGTQEAGRALYDVGMMYRRLGRDDDAVASFLRLVRDEPHAALAEIGVRRLYQIFTEREELPALEQLLAEEIPQGEAADVDLGAVLRLSRARTLAELDRPREAYAELEAASGSCTYPYCVFWDDLPWEGAWIAHATGDYPRAIDWLDRLLAWKEECWFFNGSYYSAFFDDAQKMKAEILRDDLDDPEGAADAFLELEDFADSVLRDDGLWEAARLFLERLDQSERGCETLREMLDEYPDSNRRRDAEERLAQAPCG